jgi:hypothetical protein
MVTLWRRLALLGAAACVSCGAGQGGHDLGSDAGKETGGSRVDGSSPGRDVGVDARPDADKPDARREAAVDARSSYPAAHPPMPQVTGLGGPVLTHPRVVPILYSGDPLLSTIQTFLTNLTTASYWSGATSEYGVGPLEVAPAIVLGEAPPATIDDSDIQTWIASHIDSGDAGAEAGAGDGGAPWPEPDGNTIYTVFYPLETTVTLGGLESCTYFGGYHDELVYSGGSTPYAVLPRCSSFVLLPGSDTTDILTGAVSHELVEASTDPFPISNPAYATADFDGSGWSEVMVGGELGDMCVLEPTSFTKPADVGFVVQRTWSNANASAGGDPCAPVPSGEVYFTAVPDLSDAEMYPGQYLDGISVAPGSSTTVTLHLFSDAPTAGPWTLTATEAGQEGTQIPPDPQHQLSLSLDKSTGKNGDVVKLTLTRSPLSGDETATGLAFRIESTLGTESHSYWGVAGY